jgi:hypothetical protein
MGPRLPPTALLSIIIAFPSANTTSDRLLPLNQLTTVSCLHAALDKAFDSNSDEHISVKTRQQHPP